MFSGSKNQNIRRVSFKNFQDLFAGLFGSPVSTIPIILLFALILGFRSEGLAGAVDAQTSAGDLIQSYQSGDALMIEPFIDSNDQQKMKIRFCLNSNGKPVSSPSNGYADSIRCEILPSFLSRETVARLKLNSLDPDTGKQNLEMLTQKLKEVREKLFKANVGFFTGLGILVILMLFIGLFLAKFFASVPPYIAVCMALAVFSAVLLISNNAQYAFEMRARKDLIQTIDQFLDQMNALKESGAALPVYNSNVWLVEKHEPNPSKAKELLQKTREGLINSIYEIEQDTFRQEPIIP